MRVSLREAEGSTVERDCGIIPTLSSELSLVRWMAVWIWVAQVRIQRQPNPRHTPHQISVSLYERLLQWDTSSPPFRGCSLCSLTLIEEVCDYRRNGTIWYLRLVSKRQFSIQRVLLRHSFWKPSHLARRKQEPHRASPRSQMTASVNHPTQEEVSLRWLHPSPQMTVWETTELGQQSFRTRSDHDYVILFFF